MRQGHVDEQEEPIGDDEAERSAQLREGPVQCAFAIGGVLGRHQRSARPFTAERETLAQPQRQQQDRRNQPRNLEGGQQTDEEGRHSHGEQADHQRGLASSLVPEMTEENRTDRTGDHGGAEDRE